MKIITLMDFQNGRVSSESSDDPERWQSVFAAVTERELRLYESAPWSPEAWGSPVDTCPLLSTRLHFISLLFHSNLNKSVATASDEVVLVYLHLMIPFFH